MWSGRTFLGVVGLSGSGAYSALTARVLADEMAVFCDNRKEKGDWRLNETQ